MTPKIRQLLYVFGVVVFAGLTVLSTFKIIDPDTAASVSAAVTSVLGLFGVTGFGVAAYNTNKQINDGTFDPTPDVSPADKVVQGINEVLAQAESAKSDVERVKDAVASVTKDIPVLGPLATQVLDQLT